MLSLQLILLCVALHGSHAVNRDSNSVYYTNKVTSFTPTEQSSQQEVLKELGVQLENEGKIKLLKSTFKAESLESL